MSAHRDRRVDDSVELLPLKSALVNNNYKDEEVYYPPPNNNNPTSSLFDYTLLSKRTPASKRLLSRNTQPAPTPLVTLCGAPPPSRKREELAALANLRKKVAPALLTPDRNHRNNNYTTNQDDNEPELDNRPKLLKKGRIFSELQAAEASGIHDVSAMSAHRDRRVDDSVELLPLKSALVNNNYKDEEVYYPPPNNNNPTSSLFDYTLLSKRTPASKRLLSRNTQPAPTPLVTLCGAPPPSRKREELAALANLRKKVAPALLTPDRNHRNNNYTTNQDDNEPELDNRPKLLKKVLQTRPVSMVVQWSEIRTAWQDSDFITECLCWHNVYRQRHGAPELYMAPELCDYAQSWANHLAHTNKFYYRNDRDVGQNLYQRPVSALQPDITGQEASSYWYASVRQYNFYKIPDVLHANVNGGYFTQMVWVSTRFFGVGKARSRAGKVIVVANYSPPGNISGQFEANVLPPLPENYPDFPTQHEQ